MSKNQKIIFFKFFLILFLTIDLIELTKFRSRSLTSTKTEWSLIWFVKTDVNKRALVFDSFEQCYASCELKSQCYKVTAYEDQIKMLKIYRDIPSDLNENYFICYEKSSPISPGIDYSKRRRNTKLAITSPSEIPTLKYSDVCNSFCQASWFKLCNGSNKEGWKCPIFD